VNQEDRTEGKRMRNVLAALVFVGMASAAAAQVGSSDMAIYVEGAGDPKAKGALSIAAETLPANVNTTRPIQVTQRSRHVYWPNTA